MARSADELPREGFDTQQFIENLSERVGANNTVDVIMRNLPRIARQVGAKPPAFHPSHSELNMVKQRFPQNHSIQQENPSEKQSPPKMGDTPEIPRNLHTPMAKMMPGANTEPGQPISEKDAEAFNKAVEMNNARRAAMQRVQTNPWETIPSPFGMNAPNLRGGVNIVQSDEKTSFFKDGLGNEFKIVGNKLYVLGWQDAKVKVRLINETTGKEVPTNGRKFQIYGWHLVQRVNEDESTVSDDVSKIESEIKVDDSENNVSNTQKEKNQKQVQLKEEEVNNESKNETVAESKEIVSIDEKDEENKNNEIETKLETVPENEENEATNRRAKIGKRRLI